MTLYLSGSAAYAIFLIYRMFQDKECSKTDLSSWTTIAIASLFWVIVIPGAVLELRSKNKAKNMNKSTGSNPESDEHNTSLAEY
ncbi:MAG: hypothetical protein AAGE96_21445 [Cyanobacteria bacterium P01_G01_bin.19]